MGSPAAAVALLLLCLGAPRRAEADVVDVQLVGERVFLDDPAVAGRLAQLGNLSALTYDQSLDRWFAASSTDQRCGCLPRTPRVVQP
jgi:hypothetical protein